MLGYGGQKGPWFTEALWSWRTRRIALAEDKGRLRLDTCKGPLQGLCSGDEGDQNEPFFFFATPMVPAWSHPPELFWVVWGLLYSSSSEEIGQILVACFDFEIYFADKIDSVCADLDSWMNWWNCPPVLVLRDLFFPISSEDMDKIGGDSTFAWLIKVPWSELFECLRSILNSSLLSEDLPKILMESVICAPPL